MKKADLLVLQDLKGHQAHDLQHTLLAGLRANGSSQVKVLRRDGTEATYPTRYELKVVSFDVVDENQDGINEPGEHLFVKNVRVENTGGMPGPKSSEIQVLIHGTHGLDPIASEPIFLPRYIPPGAMVEVPGVLRAFFMQERAPRKPGQLLYASDGIQLIATATQLQRTLPDFSGSTQITIRYPLELGAPRYLDCVEKGDEVTFSWVLRNVSTKPYGIGGIIQRAAGTSLTDSGHVFDFADAAEGNKHKVVNAALAPVGLGQFLTQTLLVGFGSRKAKLHPQLNMKVDEALSLRFAGETLAQLKAHVGAHTTTTKAHLKGAGSTRKGLNDLIQKRIAEYSEDNTAGVWCNLPLESRSNTEVVAQRDADARLKLWVDHMEKVNTHQGHAAKVRDEMVTKK